jgi:hypothetical protein
VKSSRRHWPGERAENLRDFPLLSLKNDIHA